ncbi:hypothetical protein LC574_02465 [Nostoc sp. CHAB 5715]|nr:hypothetical protein [Nostoc sp. CHAB 5715]
MTNAKTTETKATTAITIALDTPTIITLNDICAELKLDRREARLVLRMAAKDTKTFPTLAASHKPREPWAWEPSSTAYAEARKALSMPTTSTA